MRPDDYRSRWWIAVFVIVGGSLVYVLQRILLPFVLAFLLAYILLPVVNDLERRLRLPRLVVVFLLYLAAGAPLGLVAYRFGPSLVHRSARLIADLPQAMARDAKAIFGDRVIRIMGTTLSAESVTRELSDAATRMLSHPAGLLGAAGWGLDLAIALVLVAVLLFYVLVSVHSFAEVALHIAPPGRHPRLRYFGARIDALVGRYLRGLFLVVLFQGIASFVGFWLLGLPDAVLAAALAAVLEPLPGIGPVLAIAAVGTLAMATVDIWLTLQTLAVLIALRLLIDNMIGPLVLGWAVRLHPVFIILAFLIGLSLFGVIGLLLAIPVAATIRLLMDEWESVPEDPKPPEA